MRANDIIDYLEKYFPLSSQESWDSCGLQIGSTKQKIKKVMIALNADNESLQKAIILHCDMLITHHPFLLETIKNIDLDEYQGQFISQAITHKVLVYSLHTCLDRGQHGISMNDWLIHKLKVFDIDCYYRGSIGKKAKLAVPMETKDFIKYVKEVFKVDTLKFNRGVDKVIGTVAICGGSAADDIEQLHQQVDCFITGDTKHRHAKYAMDHNILLIDINHHIEVIMEEEVKKILEPLDIEVVIADSQDYYQYR